MILAFDLGRELGVAYGGEGSAPTLETHALSKEIGALLYEFEGIVLALTRSHDVRMIAWEKPAVFLRNPGKSETTNISRQFGEAGALARIAHGAGYATATYAPRSLRKRICGSAKASEMEIMQAAHIRGAHPKTNHEADAFLVWQAAMEDRRTDRMGRSSA